MPKLRVRIANAARALFGSDAGTAEMAAATVREWETHDYATRYRRTEAASLAGRFLGVVKVAASRNAMAVASLPLRVYLKSSPGRTSAWDTRRATRKDFSTAGRIARKAADTGYDLEEVTDPMHPLVRMLEDANSRDNGFSLIEDTQLWLGLTGNGYWHLAGEPPEALWPLAPQFVHVIPDRTRFIAGYVYGRGTENETTFTADQVVQFRNPNPMGSPYYGRGDLEACIEEADLGRAFVQFALATLNNGAQPGLVVSSKSWVTPAQVEEARAQWERMYQGRFKAGRSLFLSGEVNVTPWSVSDKEMAFLASAERVDNVVANCFDMPVSILRLDTAALATAKAAIPQWQLMAIRPRAQRIEDTLNARLCPLFGDKYFVCFDEAVQRDEEADATVAAMLKGARIINQNEAREKVGYEAVEGGDEFDTDPATLPVAGGFGDGGSDTNRDRAGGASGSADSGKSRGMGVLARGSSKGTGLTLVGAVALSASSLLWSPSTHACCADFPRTVTKDDRFSITASEHTLETTLRAFFRGVTPRVLEAVRADGTLAISLAPDSDFGEGMGQHVNDLLRQLYDAGSRAGVTDLQGRAPDPVALQQALTEGASAYVQRFGGKMIESVGSTLSGRIESTLAEGISAGETMTDLTARVREVMDGATEWGAERIARTETSRAFLGAREEAWRESGIVKGKRWLLSADPCPICMTIARRVNAAAGVGIGQAFVALGETIALIGGGTFTCDYAAMETPPAHPGCRCSTAAVLDL